MADNRFTELVQKCKGFEMVIGFQNDEDHIIGGAGNKCWYCIKKGRNFEAFVGSLTGDEQDRHIKKKSSKTSSENTAPGTAMRMILERAYFGQAEIAEKNKKGQSVTKDGIPCLHYMFGFGDRAYDISEEYGVTTAFSDIHNVPAGYHLRSIETGKKVKSDL